MKIGFIGTSDNLSRHQMEQLRLFIRNNKVTEFHHGYNVGSEVEAHRIALPRISTIVVHPSLDIEFKIPAEEMENVIIVLALRTVARNHDIVDSIDVLIDATESIATDEQKDMLTYARSCNKRIIRFIRG